MTESPRTRRKPPPDPGPLRRYLLAALAIAYLVAWWSFRTPEPAANVAEAVPEAPPPGAPSPDAPAPIVIYVPATASAPGPVPVARPAPRAPTKVRVAPKRRARIRTRSS